MSDGERGQGGGAPGPPGPQERQQAADLVAALRGYAGLPGVRYAALSALVGLGVTLLAGLLVAIVMPESSLVTIAEDGNPGTLQQALFQACGMTLAPFDVSFFAGSLSITSNPLLFALFPLGGCALGAYAPAARLGPLSTRQRLVWGAATAVPFALAMLLVALLAGSAETGAASISPADGSVFLLALLWGGLGGLIGAGLVLRRDGVAVPLPSRVDLVVRLARATLVPLALALAVAALVGTGVWIVQTARDSADAREDRSLATALADDVFFAGDYGLRYLALGSGAQFQALDDQLARLSSLPFGDAGSSDRERAEAFAESVHSDQLPIPLSASHREELLGAGETTEVNPSFTLFDYGDELPSWAFAPLLLILIVLPAFFALGGGFGVARAVAAATPRAGAAWGALVGPVWAVATAILAGLAPVFFGQILAGGFFAIVLLAGAALGALGGLVAVQQARGGAPPAPAGAPSPPPA